MRKFAVALAVLLLLIPALAAANTARTSALASGDARFLPDDNKTTEVFPGRIHQHQRISFENVNPSASSSYDHFGHWGGFTTDLEEVGGTIGWFVNRPSNALMHQHNSQGTFDEPGKTAHSEVEPATSVIDLFYGNEQWGFTGQFGTSSEEVDDPESSDPEETMTWRNMIVDAVVGVNAGASTEIAGNFFLSRFGELEGDEQEPNAIGLGANVRHQMDLAFFNYLVFGANFLKDIKVSDDEDNSAPSSFGIDANLLNYRMMGGESMGGGMMEDLTYLLAIGVAFNSYDSGVEDSDRINAFTLPKATAGAELQIAKWLTVRGSVNHTFNFVSGSQNDFSGGSTTTTVGAGLHWGKLCIDMVVNNDLLTDGPNFVGGENPGVSNFVSIDWAL